MQRPYPTYVRVKRGKMLAGVCSGMAAHLNLNVLWVRAAFAVLCVLPFGGPLAYLGLFIASRSVDVDPANPDAPISKPDAASWVLLIVSVVFSAIAVGTNTSMVVVVSGLAVVGALLLWGTLNTDRSDGQAIRPSAVNWLSMIAGVLLLAISVSFIVMESIGRESPNTSSETDLALVMLSGGLFLLGCVVVFIPLWLRLWSMAADTQRAQAREEERDAIASRIHDSVLQTLTLIQKQSSQPEISKLARSQERQLRQWLFGAAESTTTETLFGAARVACGEVEDMFGVELRPVFAGQDTAMNDQLLALIMAAREAMVNAAKHSGCSVVNVFVETTASQVEVFVRDRGPGFNSEEVPSDRYGVRRSIVDRVQKVGGTVDIDSGTFGTEVTLTLPLAQQPHTKTPAKPQPDQPSATDK